MIPITFVLFLSSALAALFPTSPTNNTTFHPGKAHKSMITWIDDSTEPPANQLGRLRIELMLENTVIATLGENVPSSHREFTTHIPRGVGPDGSDYAIAFIPPVPFLPIYSARFTISNHTSITPYSSVGAHNTTITTSPSSIVSSTSVPDPTSTFQPSREKIGTTENGSHRMRAVNSVRFKALYVLWPALVGVALAS